MSRWSALAVALALGCDDPGVSDAVTGALLHGAVSASIRCSATYEYIGYGGSPIPFVYKADRFLDGSVIVQLLEDSAATTFWNRDDAEAASALITRGNGASLLRFEAAGGELTAFCPSCSGPADVADAADIDVVCTGFNLEAFGVE